MLFGTSKLHREVSWQNTNGKSKIKMIAAKYLLVLTLHINSHHCETWPTRLQGAGQTFILIDPAVPNFISGKQPTYVTLLMRLLLSFRQKSPKTYRNDVTVLRRFTPRNDEQPCLYMFYLRKKNYAIYPYKKD